MRVQVFIRILSLAVTSGCLLLPSARLFGDQLPGSGLQQKGDEASTRHNESNSLSRRKQQRPQISDVALDAHGKLQGTFVDRQGRPMAGSLIVARQVNGRSCTAVTDAHGTFEAAGLSGGIWSVTVGEQSSWLRAWTHSTAPPAAKSKLLLVRKAPVVRGQSEEATLLSAFDAGNLFSTGAILAGATFGIVGISEAAQSSNNNSSPAASDEAAAMLGEMNAMGRPGVASVQDISTQGPQDGGAITDLYIDELVLVNPDLLIPPIDQLNATAN